MTAIYASSYVVGDDSTDDHVALGTAFNDWIAAARSFGGELWLGDIIIDKPCYIGSSTITVTGPSTGQANGGRIIFTDGAYIRGSSAQLGLHITTYSGLTPYGWRWLETDGLHLENCGFKLSNANNDAAAMAQVNTRNTKIAIGLSTPPSGVDGFLIEGLFESNFERTYVEWVGTNGGVCIHMKNGGTGLSSNVLDTAITRGGVNGILIEDYDEDVTIRSPTVLFSDEEGIVCLVGSPTIEAPHVESCCTNAGSGANAGIYVSTGGTIINPVGLSFAGSNSNQKYAVAVDADNPTIVIGGSMDSDLSNTKVVNVLSSSEVVTLESGAAYSYDYNTSITIGHIDAKCKYALTATANTTFAVPAGHRLVSISFRETNNHSVTGGVKIGTTSGAADVVPAQTVGAHALGCFPDAAFLKGYFSATAATTLFIQAGTSWNSAHVDFVIRTEHV